MKVFTRLWNLVICDYQLTNIATKTASGWVLGMRVSGEHGWAVVLNLYSGEVRDFDRGTLNYPRVSVVSRQIT